MSRFAFTVSVALSVPLALPLALAGCESPTSPLDAHDLNIAAQQVASLAGEGEWLAQELRVDHITAHFASVHQQALGEDAAKVSRDLATRPVPPALQAGHEELATLDAQLQVQVTRIAGARDEPQTLAALQQTLHTIAERAQSMASPS